MEYRKVRIDHGKVIQAEAKQYGNRKGEGGLGGLGGLGGAKGTTRHSRQMAQGFDIYNNLSVYVPKMVCGRRRICFAKFPCWEGRYG